MNAQRENTQRTGLPVPELLRTVGQDVRQQRGGVAGAVPVHRLPPHR